MGEPVDVAPMGVLGQLFEETFGDLYDQKHPVQSDGLAVHGAHSSRSMVKTRIRKLSGNAEGKSMQT